MPCKTCETATGLAVCLFCGHSFCGSHRSERDGATACTACQEAEHARSSGRAVATKTVDSARVAIGTPVTDVAGAPGVVTVTAVPPPQPIPEAGWLPVVAGLAAGAATGGYLWVFVGWLLTDLDGVPGFARGALTGVGAVLAFAGVWIIAKSRLS